MAERIACSCVTCPSCGTWVVLPFRVEIDLKRSKSKLFCTVPDCGREFEFDLAEARTFDLPLRLFERRYFYRSEFQASAT